MVYAAVNFSDLIDTLIGLLPVIIVLGILMLFLSMFGLGRRG
jgi:hypothetical protein